tara:strand:- start:80 stop:481 length:402 start_codon:yes stop_codon:yes gene_type:complete
MKGSSSYLNKCLLLIILLGIGVIMFKEKEGFGNALEDAYDGAFLKYFITSSSPEEKFFDKAVKRELKDNRVGNFKQNTNNVKYPPIPCGNENYDGGICRALYKENNKLKNKSKHCMPGFDCTRVGFYCSSLTD